MSDYTKKQTRFEVAGSIVLKAMQNVVVKFQALKVRVFDKDRNLHRHIRSFVNEVKIGQRA